MCDVDDAEVLALHNMDDTAELEAELQGYVGDVLVTSKAFGKFGSYGADSVDTVALVDKRLDALV